MAGEWIAAKAAGIYGRHFPGQWREVAPNTLQGRCPAGDLHSKPSAETDARIFLGYGPKGEKPGCYCLHNSCAGRLADMNRAFRDEIFAHDADGKPRVRRDDGVAPPPLPNEASWIPKYNEGKLRGVVIGQEPVDEAWFEARSPVDPRGIRPGEFLEYVFEPGDRVLVFTNFFSQGDFLWEVGGRGGFRLGRSQDIKAVPSKMPQDGGRTGIWYLCNPVDGKWRPNPRRSGKFSRRSEEAVTAWRHVVLESDNAPQDLWLRFLAMAPLAISAIYSSGGKSWHALIRVDQPNKAAFDAMLRASIKKTLPMVGADPGAMTPVRLTRLPGCTRDGRLQRCIWIDPKADHKNPHPIKMRNIQRDTTT
jgi:hypothetical protein